MKRAFTLIEMLIVICILAIFSFVLFKTYNTISEISFRVEWQKKVNEEFLFVSEVLQNFTNRNSIDYEEYGVSLVNNSGFTDILYLSGEDGKIKIFSSGNCVAYSQEPDFSKLQSGCSLFLQKDGESPIKLTSDSVYFSSAKFKIIPYSDGYFKGGNDGVELCNTNYFACVNDDGFWLFVDIYPKYFKNDTWANDVHLLVQHFFNI